MFNAINETKCVALHTVASVSVVVDAHAKFHFAPSVNVVENALIRVEQLTAPIRTRLCNQLQHELGALSFAFVQMQSCAHIVDCPRTTVHMKNTRYKR